MRYSAFISYSYRDRVHATWLHRALENYRVPKRLWGRDGAAGPIGKRLPPVFRDRDELAAAADLGSAVQAALEQADNLIVICSPAGAASKWVNEEIRAFTRLGRRDRVRCLIVSGEPNAKDPAQECLPPALFEDGGVEPLAADIRKGQDPRPAARLKLISSILGVPYDELRQREAARRQKRLIAIAVAASVGFVAMAALAITAVYQRDLARQRTITAERTVGFVESMFREADPSKARGATITAREVLDSGARRIAQGLAEEPAVRAELGVTLGEVYGSLGLYREGAGLIQRTLGIQHGQRAITVRQLAALADSLGNAGAYEKAVPIYQRGIALAREGDDGRPELLPRLLVGLAEAQSNLDQVAEADRSAREALAINLARGERDDPEVARDLEALANNAFYDGRLPEARGLAQRALAIRLKREGPNSPSVSDNINILANVAKQLGDNATAERYYRSRLAIDERVLGKDHPDIATTLNNLGRVLIEQRRYAEADALLERAVKIDLRERGGLHDDMAFHFSNLAMAKAALGQTEAARRLFDAALKPARRDDHVALGPILTDLAALECAHGAARQGLTRVAEARPIVAARYADKPWRSGWVDIVEGSCRIAAGDRAAGAALIARGTPAVTKRWGPATHFGLEVGRYRSIAGLP